MRKKLLAASLFSFTFALSHAQKPNVILINMDDMGYADTEPYGMTGNKAPFFPTHYGFDTFYVLPYSNDIWPVDYDGTPVTDPNNRKSTWPPLPLIENDQPVDTIRTLAHPMPHVPIAVSEKFKGKSRLGLFGDVIMELDWSLGQILKALDDAGIADNTLLIVTSDNGPWKNFGDHAGSTGGVREGKNTTWDGGNRIPCFMRWPGKIEAGSVNSELVANMDILPTIMAATHTPLPSNQIDGLNFLPVWTGQQQEGPREVFYYYFGMPENPNLEGVRYRNWKLVLPHQSGTYAGVRKPAVVP